MVDALREGLPPTWLLTQFFPQSRVVTRVSLGSHDQFFPLHGTTLENRDVGEIETLELIVQVTEALSDGTVQDDPQGSVFIRMRGKKDHGLEEIGVPQTGMRQENAARQASGRLKSLG